MPDQTYPPGQDQAIPQPTPVAAPQPGAGAGMVAPQWWHRYQNHHPRPVTPRSYPYAPGSAPQAPATGQDPSSSPPVAPPAYHAPPPVVPPAYAPPAQAAPHGAPSAPPAPAPPAPAGQARPETDDEYVARFMGPGLIPGTMSYNMTRDAILARRAYEANPANQADVQRQSAESNALRSAFTYALGFRPDDSPAADDPAARATRLDPRSAYLQFVGSGYTGAQAAADGWGQGQGTPGYLATPASQWLNPTGGNTAGQFGIPGLMPPSSSPAPVPVPPPVATQSTGVDPYHPPGYTPGIAEGTSPPPAGQPAPLAAPPPVVPPPPRSADMASVPRPPTHAGSNPTATPNIPGQSVTDFTYPVSQPPPFRPQAQGNGGRATRKVARDLGSLE